VCNLLLIHGDKTNKKQQNKQTNKQKQPKKKQPINQTNKKLKETNGGR
jgi:hypothetical protein